MPATRPEELLDDELRNDSPRFLLRIEIRFGPLSSSWSSCSGAAVYIFGRAAPAAVRR